MQENTELGVVLSITKEEATLLYDAYTALLLGYERLMATTEDMDTARLIVETIRKTDPADGVWDEVEDFING